MLASLERMDGNNEIERLQFHTNNNIYQKAQCIIQEYIGEADEEDILEIEPPKTETQILPFKPAAWSNAGIGQQHSFMI